VSGKFNQTSGRSFSFVRDNVISPRIVSKSVLSEDETQASKVNYSKKNSVSYIPG
jgi:hypothetical protein